MWIGGDIHVWGVDFRVDGLLVIWCSVVCHLYFIWNVDEIRQRQSLSSDSVEIRVAQ